MKPTQSELTVENSFQVELVGHSRFMELGEKQKAGEIQMTALERGNLGAGKVSGPRYLWRVVYEVLKTACTAPAALEPKPERFVQQEMI